MGSRLLTALLLLLVLVPGPALARQAAPAPARLSRPAKGLRLKARLRLARIKLKRSALGRGMKRATMNLRGGMTWLGDRIELNAPGSLGRGFHRLRRLSPFSLGAFALHKLRQDPWFSSAYGTWSLGFSNAVIPLSMALGFGPVAAAGIRLATGLPVDLAALTLRQHHLMRKKDPGITWGGTLRQLSQEYVTFSNRRRQENRAFMAGKAANGLRSLAAPLVASP